MEKAVDLYKQGLAQYILPSGGTIGEGELKKDLHIFW